MNRVLIHGRSRSGTTITRKILSCHSDIQIFEEKRIYEHNINQILDIEKRLYESKTNYFGDKTGTFRLDQFELLQPLNIKFIFIYRDGRDVVSSSFRAAKKVGSFNERKIWRSSNIYKNSYNWARLVERGLKAYEKYKPHLKIRFEDYFEYPEKNATLISDFLKIDKDELIKCEHKMFKSKKSHIGDYNDWIPMWHKEFHPKAIKKLKELKYIN